MSNLDLKTIRARWADDGAALHTHNIRDAKDIAALLAEVERLQASAAEYARKSVVLMTDLDDEVSRLRRKLKRVSAELDRVSEPDALCSCRGARVAGHILCSQCLRAYRLQSFLLNTRKEDK